MSADRRRVLALYNWTENIDKPAVVRLMEYVNGLLRTGFNRITYSNSTWKQSKKKRVSRNFSIRRLIEEADGTSWLTAEHITGSDYLDSQNGLEIDFEKRRLMIEAAVENFTNAALAEIITQLGNLISPDFGFCDEFDESDGRYFAGGTSTSRMNGDETRRSWAFNSFLSERRERKIVPLRELFRVNYLHTDFLETELGGRKVIKVIEVDGIGSLKLLKPDFVEWSICVDQLEQTRRRFFPKTYGTK
jgi:hypothetical protein